MNDYLGLKDLFVDEAHENAFYDCLEKGSVGISDVESHSLFFIN